MPFGASPTASNRNANCCQSLYEALNICDESHDGHVRWRSQLASSSLKLRSAERLVKLGQERLQLRSSILPHSPL